MAEMCYLDARAVRELVAIPDAVGRLGWALLSGEAKPEQDSPRLFSPAGPGEFLMMPAVGDRYSGVKTLTLASANASAGLPKVQGTYTLFDSLTFSPVAVLDAAELTLVRTPAVTMLALTNILRAKGRETKVDVAVVFGSGPQAEIHAKALWEMVGPRLIRIVSRRPHRAEQLAGALRGNGVAAVAGRPEDVRSAHVVVCATSSKEPLFHDEDIRSDAIVCAIGSHGLDAREVPTAFARRADVVVEARSSTFREGGNLIPARPGKEWEAIGLPNLADLAADNMNLRPGRPTLFSGIGMAWEDLVIATYVYQQSAAAAVLPGTL